MGVVILFLLLLLSIAFPRSKYIAIAILLYMMIQITFDTGAPDTGTYRWIYNDLFTGNLLGAFEPLFTALMVICKIAGLPFVGFRGVLSVIYAFLINRTYSRHAKYQTLAIGLFLLSTFPWNISGIRAGLACAVLMATIPCQFKEGRREKQKFCVGLAIATLIHYSSILFVILLLANKKMTKAKLLIVVLIAVIGILVVQYSSILLDIVSKVTNREKILTWLSGGPGKEGYPNLKGFLAEMIILSGNIFLSLQSKKLLFRFDISTIRKYNLQVADVICNMNILAIVFVPLLRLNDTYMRLLYVIHSENILLYVMAVQAIHEYPTNIANKYWKQPVGDESVKIPVLELMAVLWVFAIAIYQTWAFLGTSSSVVQILNTNMLFEFVI